MRKEFENRKLPKTYSKNGKECFMDSIRNKLIYVTPEVFSVKWKSSKRAPKCEHPKWHKK